MLVCEKYEARIGALIDNELTAAERVEVLEHLAVCEACKAYWEQMLLIRDMLREPEEKAPAGFANAVMARVRVTAQESGAAAEKKTVRFPVWKRFAGLAACCAVVLLGVWAMDLAPGVGMDDASVRNGCAPQMYAEDAGTGGAAESYGLNTADGADVAADADCGTYDAFNANAEMPESSAETDDAAADECEAAATLMTDSEVARRWVEDTLGETWRGGKSYVLSEEQYIDLRKTLEDAGEQFNEVMGEIQDGSYLLLTE